MQQKIIITGANGLIGSQICKLFYTKDIDFVAIYHNLPNFVPTWQYKILDLSQHEINGLDNITHLIHCAALIPSIKNTYEHSAYINQKINKNIFNFISNHNSIKQHIFISTTNIYNLADDIITESSPLYINNLYAKEKVEAENTFLSLSNLKTVCLRINAPYHFTTPYNTVLKIFIENACKKEPLLYTGTGARRQDFIHTEDIANLILKVIEKNSEGIYNVASGTSISMKELAEKITSLVPHCNSIVKTSEIPDSQENNKAYFDISKLKTDMDWQPNISLDYGLKEWIHSILN